MKRFLSVLFRVMCILGYLAVIVIFTGCPAQEEEFVWHEVVEDSEPPFENGWHNTTDVNDETCGFGKDSLGFVHLKGAVIDYSYSAAAPIFTMPVDYRPVHILKFNVPSATGDDDMGLLYVDNNGYVSLVDSGTGNGSQVITSLDGITFFAEQ